MGHQLLDPVSSFWTINRSSGNVQGSNVIRSHGRVVHVFLKGSRTKKVIFLMARPLRGGKGLATKKKNLS